MRYDLTFDIPEAVYARAITQPLVPRRRGVTIARNLAAAVLAPLALYRLNKALFGDAGLIPLLVGFMLGATLTLLVWKKQQLVHVGHELERNSADPQVSFAAGPEGIVSSRGVLSSQIGWPAVTEIRQTPEAVLVCIGTSRLVVPITALEDVGTFVRDLENWRAAGSEITTGGKP
ncbi:hypothetical protein [Sagittula sp. S175]|uniref:hypothetical protein n=1 Tax=Sagittula sp. S175 TaxID=3415129 RepID=UPI003C7C8139